MRWTSLARQAALPVLAALSIGLLACGGGGGQPAQTAAPAPNPAPTAPPAPNPAPTAPPSPAPGTDPAPPAPEAVRLPMRTMDPGAVVTLAGGGRLDPEDGPLSCSWRQTAGTLRVELRGADTCNPEFDAPNRPGEAVLAFTLTATDAAGAVRAVVVETITVRGRPRPPGAPPPPSNRPPAADAGGDIAVDEGAAATLDGRGSSDPEDGALTFAWTQTGGAPQAALSGADTARATFTAPELEASAVLTFTLTVTDPDGAFASDTANVTVRADNDAPTANAGADATINDGDAVTLDGSGSSDPEGKALAFAWTQTGGTTTVALTGANTAAPTFSTPQLAAPASLTFTLTVTDPGGASAIDAVTISVRADDDTPIADAGDDFTTYEGDAAALDGSGSSDPEGGTLTWAWTQTGTPAATLSSASAAAPTFTAPTVTADATLTFTLTVSDAGGNTATDSVTVTVKNVRPAVNTVRTPASGEALEPATAKSTASSWETAEYTASLGLPLINAAEGYAARTAGEPGGGGVTIAVMDFRIYDSHPDLGSVTRVHLTGASSLGSHGTRVAGIAAARRDGEGMHGVAYNANLVDIQGIYSGRYGADAAFASAAGLAGTYSYPNTGHRDTYTADPAGSAHIIIPSWSTQQAWKGPYYAAAMRVAAGRGRIMVIPAGNDGGAEVSNWPARAVGDEGIAGLGIVATALNEDGTGWTSQATQCGTLKQYCLMAPGTAYTTTRPRNGLPAGQRLYTRTGGTSFSAPYVAGAAAVVWAAFPNKTGSQIVDRLLTTARQIDMANCAYDATTGLSAKCGHGALDLGAAMNPVGFTSMALPGSGMAPVRGTAVRLPPGASVRPVAALADTIVHDEQGFPFLHDLNAAFLAGAADDSGTLVHGFLEPARREWTVAPLGVGAAFSFAGPADYGAGAARRAWRAFDPDPGAAGEALRDYRFSLQPQAGLTVTVGQGAGAPGARTGFAASVDRDLFADGLSVRPFAAFSGAGPGVGVDWRLDGRTRLSFIGRDGQSRFGAPRARLVSVGVDRRFAGGLAMTGLARSSSPIVGGGRPPLRRRAVGQTGRGNLARARRAPGHAFVGRVRGGAGFGDELRRCGGGKAAIGQGDGVRELQFRVDGRAPRRSGFSGPTLGRVAFGLAGGRRLRVGRVRAGGSADGYGVCAVPPARSCGDGSGPGAGGCGRRGGVRGAGGVACVGRARSADAARL